MDVTIIGSGNMARGIGVRMAAAGSRLQILGRNRDSAAALAADLPTEAVAGELGTDEVRGNVVVLAVPYGAVEAIASRIGPQLDGRIVVDITNPVDFSTFDGMVTPPGSSGAEEIARMLPGARVAKAFNTTFAATLLTGSVDGYPLDVFIAGDDTAEAKTLTTLVEQSGLRPIHVGPLRRARELEAMGYVHMLVQEPLGTQGASTLKVLV